MYGICLCGPSDPILVSMPSISSARLLFPPVLLITNSSCRNPPPQIPCPSHFQYAPHTYQPRRGSTSIDLPSYIIFEYLEHSPLPETRPIFLQSIVRFYPAVLYCTGQCPHPSPTPATTAQLPPAAIAHPWEPGYLLRLL